MSILYLGIYARFLLDKKWKDEIINSKNVVATNFKGGEFDTFKKGNVVISLKYEHLILKSTE